jgi:hypothetical protein
MLKCCKLRTLTDVIGVEADPVVDQVLILHNKSLIDFSGLVQELLLLTWLVQELPLLT